MLSPLTNTKKNEGAVGKLKNVTFPSSPLLSLRSHAHFALSQVSRHSKKGPSLAEAITGLRVV